MNDDFVILEYARLHMSPYFSTKKASSLPKENMVVYLKRSHIISIAMIKD